jgi:D-3-phosphoglycerate dehydrogenase
MKILLYESPIELESLRFQFKSYFQFLEPSTDLDFDLRQQVEAIFVKLARKIDDAELSKFPNLKYVLTPTTGLNHIDLNFCSQNSIEVLSLRQHKDLLRSITSTSELIWWHILEAARKPSLAIESVKRGEWNREVFFTESLTDKKIGIVGFGRIGKQVAEVANSFRMKVFISDFETSDSHFELVSAQIIFSTCDFIVISISDEVSNTSFVDESLLDLLPKDGAVLVNCSRGHVINEAILERYLETGQLAAVGVDVLSGELSTTDWLLQSPLWMAQKRFPDRVRITPHIGGATYDSLRKAELALFSDLLDKVELPSYG